MLEDNQNAPRRASEVAKNNKSLERLTRDINLYLYILESVHTLSKLPMLFNGERIKSREWRVERLKRLNLLVRKGYGTWELTRMGKELLARKDELLIKKALWNKLILLNNPIRNDFSARLKIPVVKMLDMFPYDVINSQGMYMHGLHIPYYRIDLTMHLSNDQKWLEVFIHHKNLKGGTDEEMEFLMSKVRDWTKLYFSKRRMMILDAIHTQSTYIKFGIHDPMLKQALPKGESETVYLGRPREKIFPSDQPTEAWVSYDGTPNPDGTIHTNSKTYRQRYLLMPETLEKLAREMEGRLGGLVQQQTVISNSILVQSKILENQTEILKEVARRMKGDVG